jgi:chemotaxis protein CheY-P-specific phosphatase CheC
MKTFTTNELQNALHIARTGLEKAAESLTFFMKQAVRVNDSGFSMQPAAHLDDFPLRTGSSIYLLITDVIGELPGVCCLVFTEEEANQLIHAALPTSVTSNPQMMAEMGDAFLLEVDNIISASVVTQFSNHLKCRIHGGVPRMMKLNGDELRSFVKSKVYNDSFAINFKTSFLSDHINFSPEFLWLFDKAFIERIKIFSAASAE